MISSVSGFGQLSARDKDLFGIPVFENTGSLRSLADELSRTSDDFSQCPTDNTEGSLCECRHSSPLSFTYGTQHDAIDGTLARNSIPIHIYTRTQTHTHTHKRIHYPSQEVEGLETLHLRCTHPW